MMIVAALALAGCVEGATEEPLATAASDATDAGSGAREPIAVALDGHLAPSVFACAAIACQGVAPQPSDRIFPLDALPGTHDATLTMTWDATPATASLVVGLFACDPEKCRSDADLTWIEYEYGDSPLSFERAGLVLAEGETLYAFLNSGPLVSGGMVYAAATTPTDVHIEGSISPVG